MASLKLVLLLCVVAGVAHGEKYDINAAQPRVGDIVEDALKLLEKLQEVVKDAIVGAIEGLDGFLDKVNEAAQGIEKQIREALENAIAPFITALDHLEEIAAEAAVDITMCIGSSYDDIKALPELFIKNVTTCLAGKVGEAGKYINQTIDDVQSTINVCLDLGNQIRACEDKGGLDIIFCLGGVTANITLEMVSLPIKITNDVAAASTYITAFLPTLALCSGGVVAEVTYDAGEILANVTECVNDRLNGTRLF